MTCRIFIRTVACLLLLAGSAAAAAPLTPEENLGLFAYCKHVYDRSFPPEKQAGKEGFCKCFLSDAINLDPPTRHAIILMDEEKKDELDAYGRTMTKDQQHALVAQMNVFVINAPKRCASVLVQ